MAKDNKKKNKTPAPEDSGIVRLYDTPPAEDEDPDSELDEERERAVTRQDFRRSAFSLLAAILLFAASIVVWFYRDSFSPDRMIVLSGDSVAVAKEEYVLDSGSGQVFAPAGKGLAAATTSGFELMEAGGSIAVSHLFRMDAPAIAAGTDFAVFYDIGGTNIAVAGYDGVIRELVPAGSIISATVSSAGYITVTSSSTGYRGLVTVYDTDLNPVYEWYSSSAWIISAEVSPDGKQLAVLSYTSAGSEVRFFSLTKTEQQAAFAVSDTVLVDVRWFSPSQLCAYSTEEAFFFNSAGEWTGSYSFDGQYLVACTFGGEGFVTFALSPYRAGTMSRLVSLDVSGRVLGDSEVQSELVSLTASGSEVLVLCPDGAILLTSALTEKSQLAGLTGFKYGLLRSRGEALLVSSNFAEVYSFD